MTKQRKINSTYAIVMVIGLAFMLLFGYLVKPFSTVTVTGVKMLGVLIGLIIITCFNGDFAQRFADGATCHSVPWVL